MVQQDYKASCAKISRHICDFAMQTNSSLGIEVFRLDILDPEAKKPLTAPVLPSTTAARQCTCIGKSR